MRVSVDQNHRCRVLLDGAEVPLCFMADDEEGWADCFRPNIAGLPYEEYLDTWTGKKVIGVSFQEYDGEAKPRYTSLGLAAQRLYGKVTILPLGRQA